MKFWSWWFLPFAYSQCPLIIGYSGPVCSMQMCTLLIKKFSSLNQMLHFSHRQFAKWYFCPNELFNDCLPIVYLELFSQPAKREHVKIPLCCCCCCCCSYLGLVAPYAARSSKYEPASSNISNDSKSKRTLSALRANIDGQFEIPGNRPAYLNIQNTGWDPCAELAMLMCVGSLAWRGREVWCMPWPQWTGSLPCLAATDTRTRPAALITA